MWPVVFALHDAPVWRYEAAPIISPIFTRRGKVSTVSVAMGFHGCLLASVREEIMKKSGELNALQPNRHTADHTAAAPHQTDETQRRFLLPWRLNADTRGSLWQQGDDIGCGSGPVV